MMPPQTIAISATFIANPLADTLTFWLQTLDWPGSIEFAPDQQLFRQLLDPHSSLAQNQDGINIILLRLEDWLYDLPPETPVWPKPGESDVTNAAIASLTRHCRDFERALQTASGRSATPHLVCLCPLSPQTLANLPLEAAARHSIEQMATVAAGLDSVQLITPDDIARWYPLPSAAIFDSVNDQTGSVSFTPEFFAALSSTLARKIYRLTQPPPKVIVLDCDHTLWRGVCAEDSPTELSIEGPWRYLQKFMVAQGDAGRLLCLCSKNHEVDVMRIFAQRLDMPLRGEHLVAWRINWRPKSENLRSLADELRLGLDSFIYIDDNPLECAEVQANCPEVVTLQLPVDPSQIPAFLDHVWAFDLGQTIADDRQRQRRYRQARQRNQWFTSAPSYADFLAGLELEVRISPLRSTHLSRAAQLTQRVNQFNITTARHSEAELRRSLQSRRWEALEVEVRDRFGDYGVVGLILFATQPEALVVDTFLLSCRALGRGVEYQMLIRLGQIAVERQLAQVVLPYRPTARNQPAFEFLLAVGHQYRAAEENRVIFNLPTAIATAVHFDVETQQKRRRPAPQPSEREQYTPAGVLHADLLVRIATELATPAQLLQAIRPGRERSRAGATAELRIPETAIPVPAWSLSQELLEPHPSNEVVLVELETAPNMILLGRAVKELIRHHQVLHSPFSPRSQTGPSRRVASRQPAPLIDVDLAELPAIQQQEMIQTVAAQLHELIRPADGRLIEFALFTCGLHQPAKLLIVAHQLVIAEIPWSILLADLQTAYSYLSQGQAVRLPSKTAVL